MNLDWEIWTKLGLSSHLNKWIINWVLRLMENFNFVNAKIKMTYNIYFEIDQSYVQHVYVSFDSNISLPFVESVWRTPRR